MVRKPLASLGNLRDQASRTQVTHFCFVRTDEILVSFNYCYLLPFHNAEYARHLINL